MLIKLIQTSYLVHKVSSNEDESRYETTSAGGQNVRAVCESDNYLMGSVSKVPKSAGI